MGVSFKDVFLKALQDDKMTMQSVNGNLIEVSKSTTRKSGFAKVAITDDLAVGLMAARQTAFLLYMDGDELNQLAKELESDEGSIEMEKQKVLDVLNGLDVVESCFLTDESWILVESSKDNFSKLSEVGIDRDTAMKYGDNETFCILALAFNEGYAGGCDGSGKLTLSTGN